MKKEQTAEKTIATLVTVISDKVPSGVSVATEVSGKVVEKKLRLVGMAEADLVVRSTIDSARNLILRMTEKTRAAAESIRQRWLAVSYRYRIHE